MQVESDKIEKNKIRTDITWYTILLLELLRVILCGIQISYFIFHLENSEKNMSGSSEEKF